MTIPAETDPAPIPITWSSFKESIGAWEPYFTLFFFVTLILFTFNFAANTPIVNNNGDDKSYLVGSYNLLNTTLLNAQQKYTYYYYHIFKPLIIFLTFLLQAANLSAYFYLVPYTFYLLAAISLFLFLRNKLSNRFILFCTVLILCFNSVWWYFGNHLLPDIPAASSLMIMLFLLDRAMGPDRKFDKKFWCLTAVACAMAALFRLELLISILVPLSYYVFLTYFSSSNQETGSKLKRVVTDSNCILFISIVLVLVVGFFIVYLSKIEPTANILTYPSILLKQLGSSYSTLNNYTVNQGNPLYIPVETILSFTILPCILAFYGIYKILKNKSVVYYPALALFIILMLESIFITYQITGEQRYVTRFIPFLCIFVAVAVQSLEVKFPKYSLLIPVLCLFLIYSSYALVHTVFGEGDLIMGYPNPAMTIFSPALDAFQFDNLVAAGSGYLYIRDAIQAYPETSYQNIYTNIDPSSFAQYIKILNNKSIFELNGTSYPSDNSSVIIIISQQPLPINSPYLVELGEYTYIVPASSSYLLDNITDSIQSS